MGPDHSDDFCGRFNQAQYLFRRFVCLWLLVERTRTDGGGEYAVHGLFKLFHPDIFPGGIPRHGASCTMRSGTIPFGIAFTHADSDTVAHVERQAEAFPFGGFNCSFAQHGIFPAYGNIIVRGEYGFRAFGLAEFFQYCENTVTDDMMVVEGIRLRNDHIGEIAVKRIAP